MRCGSVPRVLQSIGYIVSFHEDPSGCFVRDKLHWIFILSLLGDYGREQFTKGVEGDVAETLDVVRWA